jgi:heavy metal translocating P-type ATPase
MNKILNLIETFKIPLLVIFGILLYLFFNYLVLIPYLALIVIWLTIFFGSLDLLSTTFRSLLARKFALDYIALLAITVAVLTHSYLVAAVIVLMLSGGNTLENYGMTQARRSLTALIDRIPNDVWLWDGKQATDQVAIETIVIGQKILVRKGEVIPLDGMLVSEQALTDESSLTGEPFMIDKIKGDTIRSGTINSGDAIVISVTKAEADSTYRKIINMVKAAQREKAPLIRLADRYSGIFTVVTLLISLFAYLVSHDFNRVLAVLVIATPCPLILATPIALMGGINAAAKKRIIVKKLASLEVLSRIKAIILDKTGTITLGKPRVERLEVIDQTFSTERVYAIAEAIERNSLHPLAKAIITAAKVANAPLVSATEIEEKIGYGISGTVDNKRYNLTKVAHTQGMAIELKQTDIPIAVFYFEDEIKKDARSIVTRLKNLGLEIAIFTGDKQDTTEKVLHELGWEVAVKTECTPEDKKIGIEAYRKRGLTTAMVGDGINDAPALALADVGMVFSHEEHTAASEAADIVILGGDLSSVTDTITIAQKTIHIAFQSIFIGIGISTLGMLLAAIGLIPPVSGALVQEAIDVAVIFNALRTST